MSRRSKIDKSSLEFVTKEINRRLKGVSRSVRYWWFLDYSPGVLGAAIARAPQVEGKLKESAYLAVNGITVIGEGSVSGVSVTGRSLGRSSTTARAVIGFGGQLGDQLTYALKQHEFTWFKHQNGQPKFLESAVTDSTQHVLDGLAEAVRKGLADRFAITEE